MPLQQRSPAHACVLWLIPLLLFSIPAHARSHRLALQQSTTARAAEVRETHPAEPVLPSENTTGRPQPQMTSSESPETSRLDDILSGFNAGVTIAGIHDSVVGWATLATPSVGYTFNDVFSMDAAIPIYMYRLAESLSPRPRANQKLVNQRGELGDVFFGFHAQFNPKPFLYQATASLTAPTGDEEYGLTTGRCTFDFNNHFEHTFKRLTPNIDLGVGDSTALVNRAVNKNYTSLGPLSHFQLGLGVELLRGIFFETDAYEQLPIGDQKIYGPSRNGRATIVTGHNVTEDNGFTNTLEIPLNRHTTLSSYYSRSLRLHIDNVAFGVTYVLRGPPPPADDSVLDDLFR